MINFHFALKKWGENHAGSFFMFLYLFVDFFWNKKKIKIDLLKEFFQ